jgi:hypothetical protein
MHHRPGYLLAFAAAVSTALSGAVPGAAWAASRLVVLPVVVGGGAEPEPGLLAALGEGLKQNPQFGVEQGDALVTLAKFESSSLPDAELARLTTAVDEAVHKVNAGGAAEAAVTALQSAREDLRAAARKGPRGSRGDDLAWRASTWLVAALLAAKQDTKAKTAAEEALLLFPGRKVGDADKLPPKTVELLGSSRPGLGGKLTLRTRPEGCEVMSGDSVLGKDPLELQVLQGDAYYFSARCPGAAAAGGKAPAPVVSHPKKVVVPANETSRQDVLDAEFERGFANEGLRRIRFSSTQERRQLEESYARRVSERFDADAVVLASVGELSGADWLNARLYLRSGYLNRQGLVRLEAQRANALGRFLATGKDVPGVLKPEEAGALLSSSRVSSETKETGPAPWYSDVLGWSFVGAGLIGFSLGHWANSTGDKKTDEADAIRNDTPRQEEIYREAQSAHFWGNIGTVGGVLFLATGVVLLAVPEYSDDDSTFMAVRPTLLPGGGGLIMGGRF